MSQTIHYPRIDPDSVEILHPVPANSTKLHVDCAPRGPIMVLRRWGSKQVVKDRNILHRADSLGLVLRTRVRWETLGMAENSSGRSTLIAALLISFSIIGASFFVASSLDRATAQLESATALLEDLPLAAAPGANARPSRPNRPDANREYKISLGDAPIRGGEDAAVTIVEWSDFQCPFCNRVSPTLAKIKEEYGDQVRLVFKHMPLSIHPQAGAAHAASEAAHRQGKFWEMHDRIFANQRDLAVETLEGHAVEIGLEMDQFRKDVKADDVAKRINDDLQQAAALGVTGTPSFFINGKFLSGAQPFANFKRAIDEALEKG